MSRREFSLSERLKASLKQPKEITSYSIDINDKVKLDDSALHWYYLPESFLDYRINLFSGIDKFIAKDESDPRHLDEPLKAIMAYEQKQGSKVKADIVTFRGLMTSLLALPYDVHGKDLDYNVVKFDGQIFIEADFHLSKLKNPPPTKERQKELMFSGYKFETIATLSKPWSETDRSEIEQRVDLPVNNIEQYAAVVRTGIGEVKLLLTGEVDCVDGYKSESDPLSRYMELKTNNAIMNDNDAKNFERKLLKIWAQSFLLGVPEIVVGFRDHEGYLKSVEQYKTEELPKLVMSSKITPTENKWNGKDAIEFYAAVLTWIKESVPEDGNVWRFEYKKGDSSISLYQLQNEPDFILDEFRQWRQSLN